MLYKYMLCSPSDSHLCRKLSSSRSGQLTKLLLSSLLRYLRSAYYCKFFFWKKTFEHRRAPILDMATSKKHTETRETLIMDPEKNSSFQLEDMREGVPTNADYSGAVAKSDPREFSLVRKLDLRIMPTLWAMYFLNYLDRNAIAQARLNRLEDDLGLVGSQYNTCISILFVGYVLSKWSLSPSS
jgi:hypothetical protein